MKLIFIKSKDIIKSNSFIRKISYDNFFAKYLKNVFIIFIVFTSININSQMLIVGEEILYQYESLHPYPHSSSQSEIVWTQEVTYTDKTATYIAVHFSEFNINDGDKVIIRSPEYHRTWEYTNLDNSRGDFWSIPIYGNKAILEIISTNSMGAYGYKIDKIARGFTQLEMQNANGILSICGEDDTEEAICYQDTEPEVYEHSRAVARLWQNGTAWCTGWLIGDEGHLMTNYHCLETLDQFNDIQVEMMAEGSDCTMDCQSLGACMGEMVAEGTELIQADFDLDYALLNLPTNVSSEYGYLTLRESGAEIDEQIYIPQHPAGWGKRIAFFSDHLLDEDGFCHIQSLNEQCTNHGGQPYGETNKVGYYADTQGNSSGSPVISYFDHCVVALHNGCSKEGCPNLGNNTALIIEDLDYVPNNAVCYATCTFEIALTAEAPECNQNNGYLSVSAISGEEPFTYLWSTGATTQTIGSLSAGQYSVTVVDANDCISKRSTEIKPEIIVDATTSYNWSDIIALYNLDPNELSNRNIYIDPQLKMDIDYSFYNCKFNFTQPSSLAYPGFMVDDGINVNIEGVDGYTSIFGTCDFIWGGLNIDHFATLTLKNVEIHNAYQGIYVLSEGNLILRDVDIIGNLNSQSIGIRTIGRSFVESKNTNISNYETGVLCMFKNNGYHHFLNGSITNVNYGFAMVQAPVIITGYDISPLKYSVSLNQSYGCIIEDCTFNSGEVGITGSGSDNSYIVWNSSRDLDIFTRHYNCNNSRIEYNRSVEAKEFGLQIFSSDRLEIKGNIINISEPLYPSFGGIQLNESHFSNINRNILTLGGTSYGIESNNGSNNTISNNDLSYAWASLNTQRAAVIRTYGGEYETIDNNIVISSGNIAGILANNSPGNTYSCNDVNSGIGNGLDVYYQSQFHDIKGNQFLDCGYDMITRSVLGPQDYKGNEFYNGYCLAEDMNDNEIQQSQFNVNSIYPHHMPEHPDPEEDWFIDNTTVNGYYDECEENPKEGTTGFDDETVLNSFFDRLLTTRLTSPEQYFVNMMNLLEYDYARDDYSLPQYINEASIWNELSDWTELASAINALNNVAKLSGMTQLTQDDLDYVSKLQTEYLEAENEALRDQVFNQLNQLMTVLESSYEEERILDSLTRDQLKIQFGSLANRNDEMVSRWSSIYAMYIDFLQTGEVVEENKSSLLAYCMECADKYGDAIHLARSLANTFDNTYFDVFDDCLEEIEPRSFINTLDAIIQPNPTNGALIIHALSSNASTIEIFNFAGKLVYKERCENSVEHKLHLNLNEGIYLIRITSVKGEFFTDKIVVTK